MTDEHEPEPGSPEWFLAQLSGGRIDSRRERREAEAALSAAGVQIPDPTDAAPADAAPMDAAPADAVEPPAVDRADEKPKARFSWETGLLEVVPTDVTPGAEGSESAAEPPTAAEAARSVADAAAPASTPAEPAASGAVPFMWNLAPTGEPDPAVNPHAELLAPYPVEPELPLSSAGPLLVPKPITPISDLPGFPAADSGALPLPRLDAADPDYAEGDAADSAPTTAFSAPLPATVFPSPEPTALITPPPPPVEPSAQDAAPGDASDVPAVGTHAPLPPGTTAHEFDPFAQDLFPPTPEPSTPVPSVDEFTIPDEGAQGQASGGPEVSSDWEDISDLLGAHPQTVDTGIVGPMPPINEILPSFEGVLSRPSADASATDAAPTAPAAPTPEPASEAEHVPTEHVPTEHAPTSAPAVPAAFGLDPFAAPADVAARRATAPIEHSRGANPTTRWLLIIAAVLLAVLIGIALFAMGRAVAAGRSDAPAAGVAATRAKSAATVSITPSASPSATPTSSPAVPPTGALPPGQTYQWDQLRGGECIDPFSTPWAQDFAVVDCNAQHAAQLVYTAPFSSDPAAPFPGEQQIASQINLLCTKPGVIDLTAAGAYSDVQLVGAYPVKQDQWDAGQRNYYCFVTRSGGQKFTSSIAGPGAAQ